jgi:hypothetical protein
MAPWGKDDGTAEVAVPVTPEMWAALHPSGGDSQTAIAELHRRGIERLRVHFECDEEEANMIAGDPLYNESCTTEYYQVERAFEKKRKLPRRIVLTYMRPGSRTPNMDRIEEERKEEKEE